MNTWERVGPVNFRLTLAGDTGGWYIWRGVFVGVWVSGGPHECTTHATAWGAASSLLRATGGTK